MMLPMMGFVFALIGIGGIISLAAVIDPQHKRSAPYVGFTLFFAGLGAFCLSMGLGLFGEWLDSNMVSSLGFFGGYVLGGLSGSLLGFSLASRHKKHLIKEAQEYGDDYNHGSDPASSLMND